MEETIQVLLGRDGSTRDDYVSVYVISDWKWPLKKRLVIVHIKVKSKHFINRWHSLKFMLLV